MAKRHTSKSVRRPRSKVLEVRVMSPRIAWLGFIKLVAGLARLGCIVALIAGAGWGLWQGIQRAFYQNPDFSLTVLDLNPNPVIDEISFARHVGINLTARPSLFDLDVEEIEGKLAALPAVSRAHAERHLPGTLMVRVTARTPKAWVAASDAGLPAERRVGGMLVDAAGVAYACPELQLENAARLPVILLPPMEDMPIVVGKIVRHPELQRCFHLLDSASKADDEAARWIESVEQINEWSMRLITRQGTEAVFGLTEHPRQIANLRAALEHASRKGYSIATINLIPKHNVPITIRGEAEPPRAVAVPEPTPTEIRNSERTRDLNQILNRG